MYKLKNKFSLRESMDQDKPFVVIGVWKDPDKDVKEWDFLGSFDTNDEAKAHATKMHTVWENTISDGQQWPHSERVISREQYQEYLKDDSSLLENKKHKTMNKLELKEANKAKLFRAIAGTNPNINSNEHTSNISLRKASKFGLLKEATEDPSEIMDGKLMNNLTTSAITALEYLMEQGISSGDASYYLLERLKDTLENY